MALAWEGPAGLIQEIRPELDEFQMQLLIQTFPGDKDPDQLFDWTFKLAQGWDLATNLNRPWRRASCAPLKWVRPELGYIWSWRR